MIKQNELPNGFELIKPLGRGGNAKVGHVRHGGQEFALKLLDNDYKKSDSPSYKRFANEIGALRELNDDEGVMPILKSSLPKKPTKVDRPWYTMPLAIPVLDALPHSPSLRSCVEAVAGIANILVRLKARNFGHRDIKPDNLFQLNGRWVIGDFGLATFPNSIEGITEQEGRPLGSRQFMAPEMSNDALNASASAADVWSLSKTLWSLTTGNPHPSYLPFELPHDTLSVYGIDEPRSHLIDRLLERATVRTPEERISIEEFATELEQWMKLDNEPRPKIEVGDLAAQMRTLMRPTINKQNITLASIDSAKEMLDALGPRINELRDLLATEYGTSVSNNGYVDNVNFGDSGFTFQFCNFKKRDGIACREAFFTVNATSPAIYQLRCSVMIQVMPDLQHRLYAQLGTNAKGKLDIFWEAQFTVPYGTPTEQVHLSELFESMAQNVRPALLRLNELIECGDE